jgi:hypothetical protein
VLLRQSTKDSRARDAHDRPQHGLAARSPYRARIQVGELVQRSHPHTVTPRRPTRRTRELTALVVGDRDERTAGPPSASGLLLPVHRAQSRLPTASLDPAFPRHVLRAVPAGDVTPSAAPPAESSPSRPPTLAFSHLKPLMTSVVTTARWNCFAYLRLDFRSDVRYTFCITGKYPCLADR